MEGVGSRLGRASSRYGPSTSTTVFNGPVRKWKRKWVHVSSSSNSSSNRNYSSNGHRNGSNFNNNSTSQLLLCRWTPLSSSPATTASNATAEDGDNSPPRRRFRYTPVAVLEEQNKAGKKVEAEADNGGVERVSSWNAPTSKSDETHKKDINEREMAHLDLELCLTDSKRGSEAAVTDGKVRNASTGFWPARS